MMAVVAAIVAWAVSKRLLEVEQCRDRKLEIAEVRAQAELVFALGAVLPKRVADEKWAIFLYNGSDKPLYDVYVESQRLDGSTRNYPLSLGAIPPGRFVVPSHPKYHWGSLVDLAQSPEPVDYLVRGKGAGMIVRVVFSDAARRKWELSNGTELRLLA